MSRPISPGKKLWASGSAAAAKLARLLPILVIGAMTFGLAPSSGCGGGFFPQVSSSATPSSSTQTATPSSTATQALNSSLSLRGSGTQTDVTDGTCAGGTCSSTTCQCLKFTGSLSSALLGNADWTAGLTVNLDECTNTGTADQFCCTGDTLLTISNGTTSAPNVLALSFTGPACVDPNSSNVSFWGDFIVLSSSSSGKFANAVGTGQINLFTGLTDTTPPVYLAAQGDINLPSK